MAPVDLNTLLRTAVKLSQPQWQALKIEVRTEYPQELLLVRGDSNQLLQVCVQIINDALHAVGQHGSRILTISAERKNGTAIIHISDASPAETRNQTLGNATPDLDSPETLSGLGLSACQGILQQHHGRILWRQDQNVGTTIRVEIPVIPPQLEKEKGSDPGVPVMWRPQPFA
jgi:C4-dicarboxylate-specific signal transduction histidine kinase